MNDDQWQSANRDALLHELERIRATLKRSADPQPGARHPAASTRSTGAAETDITPNLTSLCSLFGLSPFERDLLLLCVGMELDHQFASLCAALHDDGGMPYPTFQLALSALDNPHWSAISPESPLRYWKLLELGGGPELTRCPLRLDEKILHHLLGVRHTDQRLMPLVRQLPDFAEPAPSQAAVAERIAHIWRRAGDQPAPVFFLWGSQTEGKRAIAAKTCQLLELDIMAMSAHMLPASPEDLLNLIRLWEREALIHGLVLLLDCDETNTADPHIERAITHLIETIRGLLIVTGSQRRQPPRRPFLGIDVEKPTPTEQNLLWRSTLGDAAHELEPWIERLVFHFNLSPSAIQSAALATLSNHAAPPGRQETLPNGRMGPGLWENCRLQARPRLEEMVHRIEPKAGWEDLVLPEIQLRVLRDISRHVHHRGTVYESWGFASKGSRGLGISALFAGHSGTGKTLAAEVLARELHLDLYRIDLSSVINKYIGETEKNLRRVFDSAEEAGAILLFDEADALFGKRTDIKDSHDRYANIEVSYLLQRMEEYRGLAILTTNLKEVLDKAFIRRLRFIVNFPFPGPAEREAIWQGIFPPQVPVQDLDCQKLARLNLSGGHIRNIALNAAFLAAEANGPVTMPLLLQAARGEYIKLEKTLTEEEIKGWI